MANNGYSGSSRGESSTSRTSNSYLASLPDQPMEPRRSSNIDCISPYGYSSSFNPQRSQSTSTLSSNSTSCSSSKSSKKTKPQPVTVNYGGSQERDRYEKKADSRYYPTSVRDGTDPRARDSGSRKENDDRYYRGSSYY